MPSDPDEYNGKSKVDIGSGAGVTDAQRAIDRRLHTR